MSMLPSEKELRKLILKGSDLTAAKLDKEIKKLENHPIYQVNKKLLLLHIAKRYEAKVDVAFAEGGEFGGQDEDEWTALNEIFTTELKSFNVRGMVMYISNRTQSEQTQKWRIDCVLLDESGSNSIAIYGELMDEIVHHEVGDWLKLSNVSVFKIPDSNRLWPMTGKYSDITKLREGELGTDKFVGYKVPVEQLGDVRERAAINNDDYWPRMRGYFEAREEEESLAVCPECREIFRGSKIGSPYHCKKCGDTRYAVEFKRAKFMFFDSVDVEAEPVTAVPSKSSGIDVDSVGLIDPPEEWPIYIIEGRMSDKGDRFFVQRMVRLPTLTPEEFAQVFKGVAEQEREHDQREEAEEEDLGKAAQELEDKFDDEIKQQAVKEAMMNSLDFSCDEKGTWPTKSKEQKLTLAAGLDYWDTYISILGSATPKQLQEVITNVIHKKEGGEKVVYKVRPIAIALIETGKATVEDGKIVPIE